MANEKRLIDANALMKQFYNYYDCVNEFTSKNGYRGDTLMDYEVADMIYDCIENAPTIEAVEVVHGRWINAQIAANDPFGYYTHEVDVFTCSVCGVQFDVSECRNYCPNCGAKMDGGNEDGNLQ